MKKRVALIAAIATALVAAIVWSADDENRSNSPRLPALGEEPTCPAPRVSGLRVRRASENGYRVRLHVRAHAERGRIGSFLLRWGDGTNGGVALLMEGGARRLSFVLSTHHYRKAGTYRIWLVAEAESPSCGDMRSAPATLRVRVPLTTSYPSSP
jgi:hypothetical protein